MTVTAIPVLPAGPRLAPFIAANGDKVLPGCYGVSHGAGITGELIRHATGSRAGHAFFYIGNGQIIEAAPPAARVSPVASHPNTTDFRCLQRSGMLRIRCSASAFESVFVMALRK
jgi:cell wall-associated NlpC family hydrolase